MTTGYIYVYVRYTSTGANTPVLDDLQIVTPMHHKVLASTSVVTVPTNGLAKVYY